MKTLLVILLGIFPVHAALPSILGRGNLIDWTCRQTDYYDLCVWSLLADPHSVNADVNGLAKIMVHTIDAKANLTIHRINWLLHRHLDPEVRQALYSCADRYKAIVRGDIPQAIESLQTGDYKFGLDGTYDAAVEAMSCEEEFKGKSPLSEQNVVVHDVAVVAASIIKIVLMG